MSTNRKAGKVAVGMFLILSVVVFGSILFVGFCCVNTETIVADASAEDSGVEIALDDSDVDLKYVPVEIIPKAKPIRRGNIELLPD